MANCQKCTRRNQTSSNAAVGDYIRIFILKFDGSVEVTDATNNFAYYMHKNYPKGQVFAEQEVKTRMYWRVLHRDHKGNGPAWIYAEKVPKEVLFARMLID
ncbi:hypothetical protein HOT57_gp47 [Pseudomonas phage phCDa]|uniref:Uncharacterized protein n=1 Tax=Pseudomonas phage phCDa TaxID=2268587 RepID=A0A2Z5H8J5_9CAUD|nr:hypothetical protein HOT57_gp47 [Pseudomonas phage phCDa]AXC36491.1 hypothetical protein phCDa_47 [Pseudomonas phage phCDa]